MNGRCQEDRSDNKSGGTGFYWGILFGIIAYYSSNSIIVWICGILCFLQTILPLAVLCICLPVLVCIRISDALRMRLIRREVMKARQVINSKPVIRFVNDELQQKTASKGDARIDIDKQRLDEIHNLALWAKEWKETQSLLAKLDATPPEVVMQLGRKCRKASADPLPS